MKDMMNSEASQTVAQGGAAAVAITFLQQSVTRMIPYSFPALVLIALDLIYGVKAAKYRQLNGGQERVRFSTGLKMTATKVMSYCCWIVLASTLSVAFEKDWIEWAVLGLVYVNELLSIVGNYLETKGIVLSFVALYRLIFKKGASQAGIDVTSEEAEEIIKPKKQRDAMGRFVKTLEKNDLIEHHD